MSRPNFNLRESIEILRQALTDALTERAASIQTLNATEPLWAIAFDVIPWDPYVGVAFRLRDESDHNASSNSADWKHSHFIEDLTSRPLARAAEYIQQTLEMYDADDELGTHLPHLIFVAAAHALLDVRVAKLLQSFGVDAPVIEDTFPRHFFKYYVMDEDRTIEANYCDIVRANRVTRRFVGQIV